MIGPLGFDPCVSDLFSYYWFQSEEERERDKNINDAVIPGIHRVASIYLTQNFSWDYTEYVILYCAYSHSIYVSIFLLYFRSIIFKDCTALIPNLWATVKIMACILNATTLNGEFKLWKWDREKPTDPCGHWTKKFNLINTVIGHKPLFCATGIFILCEHLGPCWFCFYSFSNPKVTWSRYYSESEYNSSSFWKEIN